MGAIYKSGILYTGGGGGGTVDQTYDATSANAQSGTAVAEAVEQNVATKTDLYALDNTWRGMIVYVIDEDAYYKLINDLPSYPASWILYGAGGDFNEITEAEIDSMF